MNTVSTLSVIIITYNEEQNIERCLTSVRWAEEIIVFDSFSSDRTVELARKFTDKVFQHEYDDEVHQRLRGFDLANSQWLFFIDADEEVSPELKEEILRVINNNDGVQGYDVSRLNRIFGKWIYHGGWYPDFTCRLFRKEAYRAEHAEIHGGFSVQGQRGRLNGFLNHYTYDTIEQYISKMNDYTSLQVSNKLKNNATFEVRWWKIFFSPVSHFIRKYFSNKGYKDSIHGFILAGLGSMYTLALYTKLYEYRIREREGKGILPPITSLSLKPYKRS